MNLRKIFLIISLCTSSFHLIYGMEENTGDELSYPSGVLREPPLAESPMDESLDESAPEVLQTETSQAQFFTEEIKNAIANPNLTKIESLLASEQASTLSIEQRNELLEKAVQINKEISQLIDAGRCISGEASNIGRIIRYLRAFMVLKNFDFPQVLFTNPPFRDDSNPNLPENANSKPESTLKALIENEKEGILVCCFHISDRDISEHLILKNNVGINVEVVTDQGIVNDPKAVNNLIQNGINVLCPMSHQHQYETNHHKFIIFKRNILDKCLVWHGSFNLTSQSEIRSWEDVTIDDNPKIVHEYLRRFEEIKAASKKKQIQW